MAKNDPRPEETPRCEATAWWNRLSSLQKTQICDTNTETIGSVRRHETLTGTEIENLWIIEVMTSK